jgi:hypothetical protein
MMLMVVIREELVQIGADYGDARRTEIQDSLLDLTEEDLITEEDRVVTISHGGYAKSQPVSAYQAQRRGGSRGSGGQFSIALGRSGFGGIHGWAPIGRRGRRGALGLAGAPAGVAQRRGREFIRQPTPRPAHGRDSGTIAPLPTGALRTFSKSLCPRFQARTVVQPCPALS